MSERERDSDGVRERTVLGKKFAGRELVMRYRLQRVSGDELTT